MKYAVIQICCLLLFFSAQAWASLQINANGTVTDSETGLVWQQEVTVAVKSWQEALSYCATLNLGGHNDWRLPNRNELQSIADYRWYDPAIDTNTFPNTTGTFWTSTTSAGSRTSAYTVDFTSGAISSADKDTNTFQVRAVRGGATPIPPESFYSQTGTHSVTDSRTNLVWATVPADRDNDGVSDELTWQEALTHCATLSLDGHEDWRLPNRNELQSIADYRWYNPAIDTNVFSGAIGTFWTSTTSEGSLTSAYTIDFTSGAISSADKDTNTYKVLAVRSGGTATPPERIFYDNGNGTVTDSRTGLVWRKAPLDVDNDGTLDVLSWQDALAGATGLDFANQGDWRLPDRNELQSIADYRWYGPAIDTNIFPQVIGGSFWTSTTSAGNGTSAYTVDFTSGSISSSDKDSNQHYALMVRGRQSPTFGSFKFFGIPEQVITNTPFPIEVVANDPNFIGKAKLDIQAGGGVEPRYVALWKGRWKGDITVTRSGRTRLIGVHAPFNKPSLSGSSEWFEVAENATIDASADLRVNIVELQSVYTVGDSVSYMIYIENLGDSVASDITINLSFSNGYTIKILECLGNDAAACNKTARTDNTAEFTASIHPEQYVRVGVYGEAQADSIELSVQAHDAAVYDPIADNNSTVSLLRTQIPNLEGTQETRLLALPGSSKTPTEVDTVVLTHGLQDIPCFSEELWTGSKSNPPQAGFLIQQAIGSIPLNIFQFFWKGACQEHGIGGTPTITAYKRGRQNVYFAAQQLAKQLYDKLGPNYDKKIHFIGHSLGTAVNTYAAGIFLEKATHITQAQVTFLDTPTWIGKLAGSKFYQDNKNEREWGFDKDFFAEVLRFTRSGLTLYMDNYHAAKSDSNAATSAGVGTAITGNVFNRELEDPHEVGDKMLEHEGIDNDHSGVQQWYRWTIRRNEGKNFAGDPVCPLGGPWNDRPSGINDSLNPCSEVRGGWRESIIMTTDPINFPESNGGLRGSTTSTAVETSGNQPYGCTADSGNFISIVCNEGASSSQSARYSSAVGQIYSLEEEPEIPKSSIDFDVTVPEFLRYISFDYKFSDIGDGDYVYIFLDGVVAWKMSGEALSGAEGDLISSGLIPIRAESGQKKLIIALYGVGEQNAQFSLDNFKFTAVADTDNDGVADDDDAFPNDPAEWQDTDNDGTGDNADTDDDGDGISDSIELAGCSDPLNSDTDHDTILDGIEDANHNGTVDPGETNPCLQDTDSDNTLDNLDNCPTDPDKTEPGACGCGIVDTDTDGDGVKDCNDTDDDNDNLPDIVENLGCTDGLDADTDDDGIPDGIEDADHDGVIGSGETDPCDIDTDNDGIQDGTEQGYTIADVGPDTNLLVFQPDSDPTSTTDALNADSDNDGIADGVEDSNHNGQVDTGETDPSEQRSIPLSGILLLLL